MAQQSSRPNSIARFVQHVLFPIFGRVDWRTSFVLWRLKKLFSNHFSPNTQRMLHQRISPKQLLQTCLLSLSLLCGSHLSAQNFSGPESIDCDTLTNTWYVGNTVSHQILSRDTAGTWSVFVSGLAAGPHGIEVVGDRLYACSGNKIIGYALSSGTQVFSITTAATFLNGLTHDAEGRLYATDFSGKKIYKINPANSTVSVFVANTIQTPNGILYDAAAQRLVFVTWGSNARIVGVSLADSSLTTLKTTTFGNIDGVAMDGAGRFYVAHWSGNAVHRYNNDFVAAPVAVATGLSSPADIFYNLQTDTLGIPNSGNNTVRFVGVTPPPVSSVSTPASVALLLYPNPAADYAVISAAEPIDLAHATLRITDASGQTWPCPATRQPNQWRLDLRALPVGWYLVTLEGPMGRGTVQFLKQ
jgi:SMP-30/Gluconolactonase/LRE-like region